MSGLCWRTDCDAPPGRHEHVVSDSDQSREELPDESDTLVPNSTVDVDSTD